eukprot:Sspe_Gene.34829::Locus_16909_Transcript_1_1_Confidence_1.000_Length_1614::g.34829::m.34829/K07512/MECR, NRBF1; mitochondrial trans-2-enoyl-CoA reductase
MSTRNVVIRGMRYAQCGKPGDVLQKSEWRVPFDPSSKNVVVRMIAAPVHHHDKHMIMGNAGQLRPPQFPAVGGTEGVGEVEEVGSACTVLKPGDYVVPNKQTLGTWATGVVSSEDDFDRVPSDVQPENLALMSVYGTAWRLVNDFTKVKPDDVVWVLGRGAVGTAAACLLQQKGATVFMFLRDGRPNEADTHASIRRHLPLCTTIKDTTLRMRVMQTITGDLPRPKLILNGVGGTVLQETLRFAAEGCKVVSFGNMSRKPVSVSVGRHIFQDIQLLSFWYGRWLARSTREEREAMYREICEYFRTGAHGNVDGSEHQIRERLFVMAERYEFESSFTDAFNNAFQLFTQRKPVLRFGEKYEWTHSGEWHKETEYFKNPQHQYVENMGMEAAERMTNEWKAMEYGGPKMMEEFAALWETEGSRRWNADKAQFDIKEDLWDPIKGTYRRYLETEAKIYGLRYNVTEADKSPFDTEKSITRAWYPDDDPTYLNGIKKFGRDKYNP